MAEHTYTINPTLLKWARETVGLSMKDVVKKFGRKGVQLGTLQSWEDGSSGPTYVQLERLAYEIYKRPIALFFFPKPPDEATPKQSFRTLPDAAIANFAPRILYLIRMGRVMQLNLSELHEEVNPAKDLILNTVNFKASDSVETMVERVRTHVKVTLEQQQSWKGTDEAFKQWRTALENVGISVFKDAFRVKGFSGFCLYDDDFPIIYVNNSKPSSRQIFTLFHELAHLLFRTGGVDTRLDNYISLLRGDERRIEINCNKFAAAFLVPYEDFEDQVKGVKVSESLIVSLADRYNVSREVILRMFLDRKLISQQYYQRAADKWAKQISSKKGKGGDYYRNMGVYLGKRYLEVAFSKYHQGKISTAQLADYLGVKPNSVAGMESVLIG